MFWGEYAHNLDTKGRVVIPARYRDQLDAQAMLTRGLDQNLVIYPAQTWQAVTEQLSAMPITHAPARAMRRLLFSGAVALEIDKQGRINIPNHLLQYAHLSSDVLFVGMETFIEVWEPESWRLTLENVSALLADADNSLSLSL